MNYDRVVDMYIKLKRELYTLTPSLLDDKCSVEIINRGYYLNKNIKKIEQTLRMEKMIKGI